MVFLSLPLSFSISPCSLSLPLSSLSDSLSLQEVRVELGSLRARLQSIMECVGTKYAAVTPPEVERQLQKVTGSLQDMEEKVTEIKGVGGGSRVKLLIGTDLGSESPPPILTLTVSGENAKLT